MTEIENTLITHQIYFERYKTGEVNKLLQLLEDANTQIKKLILETKTIGTKKHYEKVITEIKKLAAETRSVLESTLRTDGFALTESELDYLRGKMIKTIGADINFIKPSSKQVFEAALFIPLSDTATFESFLNSFENGLFSIWDSAIRTGYITGQSTKQVVKDVLGRVNKDGIREEGLIKTLENSVKRNTRTAMQAFANEAHRSVYEQNDDLFIGYKYLATIDTRTCLTAGQKVLTPCGYRNIEELKVGDVVISGTGEARTILHTIEKETDEIIQITLEDGEVIECTPDHEILTSRGWIEAREIRHDDELKERM